MVFFRGYEARHYCDEACKACPDDCKIFISLAKVFNFASEETWVEKDLLTLPIRKESAIAY